MGELLKYGGSGMVNLLHQLFSVVWHRVSTPTVERGTLKRGIRRFQGITGVSHC